MKITYENRKKIDEQYIHDSEFGGYSYDYEKREIEFVSSNYYNKNKINLIFHNVIYSEMQSCSFWHGGNNILNIWCEENSPQMNRLLQCQVSTDYDTKNWDSEYLTGNTKYLEIHIQINSGDTLFIICESLDWLEESL